MSIDCDDYIGVEGMSDLEACMLDGDHNEHVWAYEYHQHLLDMPDDGDIAEMQYEQQVAEYQAMQKMLAEDTVKHELLHDGHVIAWWYACEEGSDGYCPF